MIARFERALAVHHGRRAGEPETRVELDHLLPDPSAGDERKHARKPQISRHTSTSGTPPRQAGCWSKGDEGLIEGGVACIVGGAGCIGLGLDVRLLDAQFGALAP